MYPLFLAAGALSGLMGAPAIARIGGTDNPARWYGISMLLQMLAATLFALLVPSVVQPAFGPMSAVGAMAVMYLPCILAAPFIDSRIPLRKEPIAPAAAPDAVARIGGAKSSLVPLLAAFVGSTLYAIGGVAFWIFLERMGRANGVAPPFIGLTVALGTVAAAASASAAAAFARNLRLILTAGVIAGVVGFLAMLDRSPAAFLTSACLFNISWGASVPAFQAVMRTADTSGRYYVAGPATIFLAAVVTGPVAGHVAGSFGYGGVVAFSIAACGLALALGRYACLRIDSRLRPGSLPLVH
jgi:hypothetical protein